MIPRKKHIQQYYLTVLEMLYITIHGHKNSIPMVTIKTTVLESMQK